MLMPAWIFSASNPGGREGIGKVDGLGLLPYKQYACHDQAPLNEFGAGVVEALAQKLADGVHRLLGRAKPSEGGLEHTRNGDCGPDRPLLAVELSEPILPPLRADAPPARALCRREPTTLRASRSRSRSTAQRNGHRTVAAHGPPWRLGQQMAAGQRHPARAGRACNVGAVHVRVARRTPRRPPAGRADARFALSCRPATRMSWPGTLRSPEGRPRGL
ncbi:hypothetical protein ABIB57_005199 [Devosia sp. UYZn731]